MQGYFIKAFENLVNYDKSKTFFASIAASSLFENLVNYDKSKTECSEFASKKEFENLVNYDKSKTLMFLTFFLE